jgi:Na+-driven multidrug efflux pump
MFLLWGLLTEPTRGANIILSAALRGRSDTAVPSMIGIAGMLGIGLPAAYVFSVSLGFGADGVLAAMLLEQVARMCALFARWCSVLIAGK